MGSNWFSKTMHRQTHVGHESDLTHVSVAASDASGVDRFAGTWRECRRHYSTPLTTLSCCRCTPTCF